MVPKNKTEYLMAINQETVLNGAISGAKAQDVPMQIDYLVWKMQQMEGVDFANDWKVITLLIGVLFILFILFFHFFPSSLSHSFFHF